jgi:hypothetical protein
MLLSELYINRKLELFDMLNLDSKDTGISKGYVYISTKDATVCTIKYSLKINDKLNIVMTVPEYKIVSDHLGDKVSKTVKKQLKKFAMKNHEKILHFWNHGTEMKSKKELVSFLNSIKALSNAEKESAKKLDIDYKKV